MALVKIASWPAFFSFSHMGAVRRSCQTMALWIGLPVSFSQMRAVSRWLVMPMAAMSPASSFALRNAARTVDTTTLPDIFGIVLHPAPMPGNAGETPSGRPQRSAASCRR